MPDPSAKKFHDGKVLMTKADANYRAADDGAGWTCSDCRFYERWSRSCNLVEGTIEPSFVSDLWQELLPSQKPIGALASDASVYTDRAFQVFVEASAAFAEVDYSKPAWIPYLPKPDTYSHALYGEVEITKESNQAIVDSIKKQVYQEKLPLDAEHQYKLSGAVGWITDARVNDDGTADAFVEWTPRGQKLLKDGAYKYISPEWFPTWMEPSTGEVHEFVAAGGAITTRPFFKDKVLRSLVASEIVPNLAYKADTKEDPSVGSENKTPSGTAVPDTDPTKTVVTDPPVVKFTEMLETPEAKAFIEQVKADAKAEATKAAEQSFNETIEAERKAREASDARLAVLESQNRAARFTDIISGRGANDGGAPWIGDSAAHLKFMEQIAEKFGEDNEVFTSYVEQQKAIAAQMKETKLFSEVGSSGTPSSDTPDGKIDKMVKSFREAHPDKTEAQAYSAVMETDEAKKLYAGGK